MPSLHDIILEKGDRLDDIPIRFVTGVDKFQRYLFSQIADLISTLDTKGGLILSTTANLDKVEEISRALNDVIWDDEQDFYKALISFVDEFPKQAQLVNQIFEKQFDFSDRAMYQRIVKDAQLSALRQFEASAVDRAIIEPIRGILNEAVIGGGNMLATSAIVRMETIGDDTTLGMFKSYATRIVRDAFAGFDRSYTKLVSNDLGVQFWLYSGSLLKNSRCFCTERKGNIYHNEEIREWGRKPELWHGTKKKCKGGGRNPLTNEDSIFILLGGYSCVDSLVPQDISLVPDWVIKRAEANGFM